MTTTKFNFKKAIKQIENEDLPVAELNELNFQIRQFILSNATTFLQKNSGKLKEAQRKKMFDLWQDTEELISHLLHHYDTKSMDNPHIVYFLNHMIQHWVEKKQFAAMPTLTEATKTASKKVLQGSPDFFTKISQTPDHNHYNQHIIKLMTAAHDKKTLLHPSLTQRLQLAVYDSSPRLWNLFGWKRPYSTDWITKENLKQMLKDDPASAKEIFSNPQFWIKPVVYGTFLNDQDWKELIDAGLCENQDFLDAARNYQKINPNQNIKESLDSYAKIKKVLIEPPIPLKFLASPVKKTPNKSPTPLVEKPKSTDKQQNQTIVITSPNLPNTKNEEIEIINQTLFEDEEIENPSLFSDNNGDEEIKNPSLLDDGNKNDADFENDESEIENPSLLIEEEEIIENPVLLSPVLK